jgi:hypothetical protein
LATRRRCETKIRALVILLGGASSHFLARRYADPTMAKARVKKSGSIAAAAAAASTSAPVADDNADDDVEFKMTRVNSTNENPSWMNMTPRRDPTAVGSSTLVTSST